MKETYNYPPVNHRLKKKQRVIKNIYCDKCGELILKTGFILPYGSTKVYCSKWHETEILVN